jgi:uracil-DNA glycosylase family protein
MDASDWLPTEPTLEELQRAAPDCRGCELWQLSTQVVFSEGPPSARLMLVGEQPGDREDEEGEPFVGPAGRLLDEALVEAGTRRERIYLTNAVKHFRFESRGKRRIHKKPDVRHIEACHPWLEAELAVVDPRVIVVLGATAGRAVLGRPVRVGAERGTLQQIASRQVLLTTHPSAVVRLRGKPEFPDAYAALVGDLQVAVRAAG